MSKKTQKNTKKSFWATKPHLKFFVIVAALLFVLLLGLLSWSKLETWYRQSKLEPFYDTSGLSTEGALGEIVRQEPLDAKVDGGTGVRILYRTQDTNGNNTFSSGMIFVPEDNSATPRPVVAWAHGTLGMGDQCAPSRIKNPAYPWVSEMLKNGWIVAATDYAGFGTPGIQGYLVGNAEASDVLNSVRAARNLPGANAGVDFVVWGHSQGGHSALFTAQQAKQYTPELNLLGTVASAPAAELKPLIGQQFGTAIDWVIGPEIAISWPANNPSLNLDAILTKEGKRLYEKTAKKCIAPAALEALVRADFKQKFFKTSPLDVPSWLQQVESQTAPVITNQPLMVVESLTDQVVLPNTTALYIQKACQAGANLTSLWLTDVNHAELANVSAPDVVNWLGDRIANKPTNPTCSQPLPVEPANQ